MDSDAKKAKLDQCAAAVTAAAVAEHVSPAGTLTDVGEERSCVVHLRNLPADMSDVELIQMCVPFGKVTNFLLLKAKNQAFLQYEDEASAAALVSMSRTSTISLRGRTVFCQFSNHHELKTDNKNTFSAVASNVDTTPIGDLNNSAASRQQSNSVLRVIVENMLYPVCLDVLHQIFSRFGKVLRIITFNKNNSFQALIQFSDACSAQLAKIALDGQNIFNACCTLRIEYSRLTTLNVKYNNDKSRDFTNPDLPSGDITLDHNLSLANMFSPPSALATIPNALNTSGLTLNPAAFAATLPQSNTLPATATGIPVGALNLSPFNLATITNNALAGVAGLRLPNPFSAVVFSPVVLVSNLNEEKVTPDALFTLFGVYGDVQRVKVLYNKQDNALIQYSEPPQAQLAIQYLDKLKLWDKIIRVTSSKHMNVQMPKEGQPDSGLTKDFYTSPLHRFKKPGSKNYLNIYPPSSTLHLSNIPPSVTDEFLTDAFMEKGFKVCGFKFFPKDHKMALVQLDSIEEAVLALIPLDLTYSLFCSIKIIDEQLLLLTVKVNHEAQLPDDDLAKRPLARRCSVGRSSPSFGFGTVRLVGRRRSLLLYESDSSGSEAGAN